MYDNLHHRTMVCSYAHNYSIILYLSTSLTEYFYTPFQCYNHVIRGEGGIRGTAAMEGRTLLSGRINMPK